MREPFEFGKTPLEEGERTLIRRSQGHSPLEGSMISEMPVTDLTNNPLTDDADQAHGDHVSMFMHVPSAEEQQHKRRGHFGSDHYI